MGAVPYVGGVTFRVWAPFATSVGVAGTFNFWSIAAAPLARDASGFWSADVPGAAVGDRYKYYVENGAAQLWRLDPYGRALARDGNALIVDPAYAWSVSSYRTPSWDELVIYEIHLGTFNAYSPAGRGTLASAREKLPDLADLGINAVELMPPAQFATDRSWGYNPSYPFAIEEAYGSLADFKTFVEAAHALGIAVIVDVVYNHFGPDDLWRFDGWKQNDKGGIYFYNDWRAATPWGDTRPDYGRGEVRQYLRDNALMWIEECRVDGLRFDATAYIRNVAGWNDDPGHDIPDGWSLMQWINREVDDRAPWKILIAEDLSINEWITKPTDAGGAGFDAQWSNPVFLMPVRSAIVAPNDGDRDMQAIRDAIAQRYGTDCFHRVIGTENHDADANGSQRVPEAIWPGSAGSWYARKRSTAGAAIALTSPGIPMLFQGQEFLADAWFADNFPLDWNRKLTYSGVYLFYRDLVRLRRNWFGTTRGLRGQNVNVYHVNNRDKVIAYHRWDRGGPGDDVIVVVNLANTSYAGYGIGFPREGLWHVRLNSDWEGYGNGDYANTTSFDPIASWGTWGATDGMPFYGRIGVGPYTTLVLSQ
jgi:1,4-alpha-glucan branching enzyme